MDEAYLTTTVELAVEKVLVAGDDNLSRQAYLIAAISRETKLIIASCVVGTEATNEAMASFVSELANKAPLLSTVIVDDGVEQIAPLTELLKCLGVGLHHTRFSIGGLAIRARLAYPLTKGYDWDNRPGQKRELTPFPLDAAQYVLAETVNRINMRRVAMREQEAKEVRHDARLH